MPSMIAASMLRKRKARPPLDPAESRVKDGDITGHPHREPQHQEMDRQHAYDSAHEAIQSLAKDGMPGADEMLKQLESSWSRWQGSAPKGMQPATKASHRASPVSKSGIDEADEESLTPPDTSDEGDITKE